MGLFERLFGGKKKEDVRAGPGPEASAEPPRTGRTYDIHPSLEEAVKLSRAGRHEEALRIFAQRTEENPEDIVAWNGKGLELGVLGHLEEASACFDRALALDGDDIPTVGNKYRCLLGLGRHEECLPYAVRYSAACPEHIGALNAIGTCLSKLGHLGEALQYFERAVEINATDVNGWMNRGVALSELGQNEEAIACYERALKLEPYRALVWYNKAASERELGRTDRAVAALEKFLALASGDLQPYVDDANKRLARLRGDVGNGPRTEEACSRFHVFRYPPFEFNLREGWQANLWSRPGAGRPEVLLGPDNEPEIENWVLRLIGAQEDSSLDELKRLLQAQTSQVETSSDEPQEIGLGTWSGFVMTWRDKEITHHRLALGRGSYFMVATLSFKENVAATIVDEVYAMLGDTRIIESA